MELEFASQMIRAVSEQLAPWHGKVEDVPWHICMTFAARISIWDMMDVNMVNMVNL